MAGRYGGVISPIERQALEQCRQEIAMGIQKGPRRSGSKKREGLKAFSYRSKKISGAPDGRGEPVLVQ